MSLEKKTKENIRKLSFENLLELIKDTKFTRFNVLLKEREVHGDGELSIPDKDRFTFGSRDVEDFALKEIQERIKGQWTDELVSNYLKEGKTLPPFIRNPLLLKKEEILALLKPGGLFRVVPGTREEIGKPVPEFTPKIGFNKEEGIFFMHNGNKYSVKESRVQKEEFKR